MLSGCSLYWRGQRGLCQAARWEWHLPALSLPLREQRARDTEEWKTSGPVWTWAQRGWDAWPYAMVRWLREQTDLSKASQWTGSSPQGLRTAHTCTLAALSPSRPCWYLLGWRRHGEVQRPLGAGLTGDSKFRPGWGQTAVSCVPSSKGSVLWGRGHQYSPWRPPGIAKLGWDAPLEAGDRAGVGHSWLLPGAKPIGLVTFWARRFSVGGCPAIAEQHPWLPPARCRYHSALQVTASKKCPESTVEPGRARPGSKKAGQKKGSPKYQKEAGTSLSRRNWNLYILTRHLPTAILPGIPLFLRNGSSLCPGGCWFFQFSCTNPASFSKQPGISQLCAILSDDLEAWLPGPGTPQHRVTLYVPSPGPGVVFSRPVAMCSMGTCAHVPWAWESGPS